MMTSGQNCDLQQRDDPKHRLTTCTGFHDIQDSIVQHILTQDYNNWAAKYQRQNLDTLQRWTRQRQLHQNRVQPNLQQLPPQLQLQHWQRRGHGLLTEISMTDLIDHMISTRGPATTRPRRQPPRERGATSEDRTKKGTEILEQFIDEARTTLGRPGRP